MTAPGRCRVTVTWFDCDLTVRCIRPEGHAGPHRDGARWWDEYGLQTPTTAGEHPAPDTPGLPAGARRNRAEGV